MRCQIDTIMDIQFKDPFGFQLEILETDDHIPSFRINVHIAIEQFQHKYQYEGNFWIECSVWDSFVHALQHPSAETTSLHDMSEHFALSIQNTAQGLVLKWEFSKKDVGGKRQMAAHFISSIDEEVLAKIRQSFEGFPVWW